MDLCDPGGWRARPLRALAACALLAACREPVRIERLAASVTEADLTGLWMADDGAEGWAVGEAGTLLRFEAGRWAEAESVRWSDSGKLNDLAVGPTGAGLAVGTDGVIARLAEGKWSIDVQLGSHDEVIEHFTERWERRAGRAASPADVFRLALPLSELPPFVGLQAVWADERADTAWLAAGSAGLLHYVRDAEVRRFEARGLTVNDLWLDRDGRNGWAVGCIRLDASESGAKDGGEQIAFARFSRERGWELLRPQGRPGCGTAIAMAADGSKGWAVADEGSVLHFNGKRWKHACTGSERLNGVWAHPRENEAWAVGAQGKIVEIHGDPPSACVGFETTGASLNGIWLDAQGAAGWAVGDAGTIVQITARPPGAKH